MSERNDDIAWAAYEEERREKKRLYTKKYIEEHKEELRIKRKIKWATDAAHREKCKEANRRWTAKNRHSDEYRAHRRTVKCTQPAVRREQMRAVYSTPSKRYKLMTATARRNAAKKGLEYDQNLLKHLQENPVYACFCCGAALDYSPPENVRGRRYTPSLDRVDNTRGYTIDNVAVVCWYCNTLKRELTHKEIAMITSYIERWNATNQIKIPPILEPYTSLCDN